MPVKKQDLAKQNGNLVQSRIIQKVETAKTKEEAHSYERMMKQSIS